MKKILSTSLLLLVSCISFSEDIELYISNAVKLAGSKTQVLIIFDNSGSMGTTLSVKEDYDPTTTTRCAFKAILSNMTRIKAGFS